MTNCKPYPAYKDSGVKWLGKIPTDWGIRRMKYVFKEINVRSMEGEEDLLSVSQYTGVTKKSDKTGVGELLTNAESLEGYKKVEKGDLVSNIMLAWNGSLGFSPHSGITSPAYSIYRVTTEDCKKFLHYLLRTDIYKSEFKRNSSGVIESRLRLYTEDFFAITALLPSPAEQAAIADFLDDKTAKIDKAIAQKQQLIALLKERKQIIIQNAVTKGLDPKAKMKDSGIEWIGEIPEHWEVKKFKWFVRSRAGFAFPSNQFSSEGIPVIRISDLAFTGYVTLDNAPCVPQRYENLLADFGLKSGDILMAMTGGTIGKVAEFWEDRCALLNQRVCTFTPKTTSERSMFLAWTKTAYWNEYINLTAFGGAQPNISDKQVLELPVPLPKRAAEMEQISYFIKTQEQKTGEATRLEVLQIQKLREYRATLIDSAVTGKIKVPGI